MTAPDQTDTTPAEPKTPPTLEELLAELPEESRTVVLGQVKKARDEAAAYRQRLNDAKPKLTAYETLLASQQTAEQKAEQQAKDAEARVQAVTARAVRSEVRALAAQDFTDPDDAAAFLNLHSYVDGDGDIDTARIRADLTDLLRQKPHLARDQAPRAPRPDRSQASGGNGRTTADPAQEFASILRNQIMPGR